jgi:hypothetical protein
MFLVIKNATEQGLVRKGRQFAITQGFALFFLSAPKRHGSGGGRAIPTKCTTTSQTDGLTDETPARSPINTTSVGEPEEGFLF